MKLNEIKKLDNKEFVLIVGGAGSGKNYHYENVYKTKGYVLVDVDEMKKMSDVTNAIGQLKKHLENKFKEGVNIVNPGTGANLKGVENKIKLAKEYGYTVTLIFIDTALDKATEFVKARAIKGGHDVPEWKIKKTNEECRKNVEILKNQVDNYKIITVK